MAGWLNFKKKTNNRSGSKLMLTQRIPKFHNFSVESNVTGWHRLSWRAFLPFRWEWEPEPPPSSDEPSASASKSDRSSSDSSTSSSSMKWREPDADSRQDSNGWNAVEPTASVLNWWSGFSIQWWRLDLRRGYVYYPRPHFAFLSRR